MKGDSRQREGRDSHRREPQQVVCHNKLHRAGGAEDCTAQEVGNHDTGSAGRLVCGAEAKIPQTQEVNCCPHFDIASSKHDDLALAVDKQNGKMEKTLDKASDHISRSSEVGLGMPSVAGDL